MAQMIAVTSAFFIDWVSLVVSRIGLRPSGERQLQARATFGEGLKGVGPHYWHKFVNIGGDMRMANWRAASFSRRSLRAHLVFEIALKYLLVEELAGESVILA